MLVLSIGSLMPLISDTRGLNYEICGLHVMFSVGAFLFRFGRVAYSLG